MTIANNNNSNNKNDDNKNISFELGFTPCKSEQSRQGMELQEKEASKDYSNRKSLQKEPPGNRCLLILDLKLLRLQVKDKHSIDNNDNKDNDNYNNNKYNNNNDNNRK